MGSLEDLALLVAHEVETLSYSRTRELFRSLAQVGSCEVAPIPKEIIDGVTHLVNLDLSKISVELVRISNGKTYLVPSGEVRHCVVILGSDFVPEPRKSEIFTANGWYHIISKSQILEVPLGEPCGFRVYDDGVLYLLWLKQKLATESEAL